MVAPAMTMIHLEDMENIALGGAFLGTGGGGDPYIGKLMARQAIAENGPVKVIDVETLPDDALVVPVAMMGAPTVMLENFPKEEKHCRPYRACRTTWVERLTLSSVLRQAVSIRLSPLLLQQVQGCPSSMGTGWVERSWSCRWCR